MYYSFQPTDIGAVAIQYYTTSHHTTPNYSLLHYTAWYSVHSIALYVMIVLTCYGHGVLLYAYTGTEDLVIELYLMLLYNSHSLEIT